MTQPNPELHAPHPQPSDPASFWERFVAVAKIVAKHISPMDGRFLPFDDRAHRSE